MFVNNKNCMTLANLKCFYQHTFIIYLLVFYVCDKIFNTNTDSCLIERYLREMVNTC